MGNKNQDIFIHRCDNLSGWDRAICEAQQQIKIAEEKIRKLNLSIETFKEMQNKGEPFPGENRSEPEAQP
jgi:hypothetical protein